MTEQEFAARLKRYRRERGLTQQALAEILGVSNSSVSRWESGSYPDVPTLAALARVLGVDPGRVNVKATTEEGLGFTGAGEGMAAHAVCLLEEI